ncbi:MULTISPECIES: biotin transporter BioY [unclassified Nonomuraea]|uniref:biotin transporter BioY n=1 Tax=unclassified Nonomuraea TaxID=2593643 RepID=UPI0033CD7253
MASAPMSIRPAVLSDLLPGSRVRDVALVVGGTGLTGLAAQLTVPLWPVPVTAQTFAVLLVGAALGMNRAAASMALYLVAGIAGVPWFAGHSSGFGGATFGYVLGFIAAAAVVGKLAERGADRTVLGTVGTMALGNVIIHAFGLPVLMAVTGLDLGTVLVEGAGKFLLGDAAKIAVAAGLLPLAWKLARR